jgi:hypothetical protein
MRASRSKSVTIGESVLLPGAESLLPPAWVPWTERLRPGDLGVGDLLPTDEDDPRLEPGWNASDVVTAMDDTSVSWSESDAAPPEAVPVGAFPVDADEAEVDEADADAVADDAEVAGVIDSDPHEEVEGGQLEADQLEAYPFEAYQLAVELDLMRPRVLSPIGLDDAVDRWVAGDHGPDAAMAQGAPATCATCGFRIALRGQLGAAFGVCANEISPSDGHVVTFDHGCGAHSEAVVIPAMAEHPEPFVDEVGYEVVARGDAADDSSEPASS